MKLILKCMFSPRLYKIYNDGPRDSMYNPWGLEKWGDKVIMTASFFYNFGIYSTPLLGAYLYMRGQFSFTEVQGLFRLSGCVCLILAVSFMMRAIGRSLSKKYINFLNDLQTENPSQKLYLETIRKYDFEFSAWPVTYQVPLKARTKYLENPFKNSANPELPQYQQVALQTLAYVATHTFALKLIYPGSVAIMNSLLWHPIFQGRTQFVEAHEGQRTKIGTADGNTLDTMFIDNRGVTARGAVLVVCCEGNAGFYEMGILSAPINAGYSTLGWNHPGFGESSGLPFPSQEQYAIDAVMQFSINELQFQPENIILYGWSIGGYTATWAATNYPVKGLILDATFDDLLPLARQHMPSSWSLLVKEVIRSHVDLNIGELINNYNGPVQFIRRTEDEILCLRPGVMSTNCCNLLLLRVLKSRYPQSFEINPDAAATHILRYINMPQVDRDNMFRVKFATENQHVVSMISRYMRDYRSTHCTPLPSDIFAETANAFNPTIRVI